MRKKMDVQTRLIHSHNTINGYEWTSPTDMKVHIKHWKNCGWCNKSFIPHHNKQKYCDKTCKQLRKSAHNARWMYHRRMLEREGVIINDRNILNVGTGGLGGHRCYNFNDEQRKIKQEMRELGLI